MWTLPLPLIAHTTDNIYMYIFFLASFIPILLVLGFWNQVPQIILLVIKLFFSSTSTSRYLPSITMANGSMVSSHGVGIIYLLPSLSIDNVFYVLGSLFNLLSISHFTHFLDCVISFT